MSEPRGRARRSSSSSGAEAESEPWGQARLDLAAVDLTLASGSAVGAEQAALFSCQVGQWSGEVTAVTSALSTEERASG
jgi:hypothetical protein